MTREDDAPCSLRARGLAGAGRVRGCCDGRCARERVLDWSRSVREERLPSRAPRPQLSTDARPRRAARRPPRADALVLLPCGRSAAAAPPRDNHKRRPSHDTATKPFLLRLCPASLFLPTPLIDPPPTARADFVDDDEALNARECPHSARPNPPLPTACNPAPASCHSTRAASPRPRSSPHGRGARPPVLLFLLLLLQLLRRWRPRPPSSSSTRRRPPRLSRTRPAADLCPRSPC